MNEKIMLRCSDLFYSEEERAQRDKSYTTSPQTERYIVLFRRYTNDSLYYVYANGRRADGEIIARLSDADFRGDENKNEFVQYLLGLDFVRYDLDTDKELAHYVHMLNLPAEARGQDLAIALAQYQVEVFRQVVLFMAQGPVPDPVVVTTTTSELCAKCHEAEAFDIVCGDCALQITLAAQAAEIRRLKEELAVLEAEDGLGGGGQ